MACTGLLVCSLIEHCLLEIQWYSSWIITQATIMPNKCMIKFLLASVGLSLYFMQKNPIIIIKTLTINVYIFHGIITERFHQDPLIHFIIDTINHSQWRLIFRPQGFCSQVPNLEHKSCTAQMKLIELVPVIDTLTTGACHDKESLFNSDSAMQFQCWKICSDHCLHGLHLSWACPISIFLVGGSGDTQSQIPFNAWDYFNFFQPLNSLQAH